MPPKVKITRDDILNIAVEMVKNDGIKALNARNIAANLKCSTQPVFSNFVSMDELTRAIIKKAEDICGEYIKKEIEAGKYPEYKASGMAYIRFAKEEKELFKLLYMRDRTQENESDVSELNTQMEDIVQNNTGLSDDSLKLFHLEMWAYVHGIAVMFATGFLDLEWELVSKMLTDVYQGLKKQFCVE